MSFFPGEKLRYAETHFKFKLPWSLLYRPWPEIIFDMPFQVVPGQTPVLWIVVRDADKFPAVMESVELRISGKKDDQRTIRLDAKMDQAIDFLQIPLTDLEPGTYKIFPTATVSCNGQKKTFTRWNLPRLKPKPITVQILSEVPPKAPGFAAGEMHCHTYYSKDHVEYGASPHVLQQAAKSIGLDFVSCTDHAYDFAFTDEDYTKEAESPVPRFQGLRDEIAKLPMESDDPLMLAGEEVSAGNSKGENVHMTVMAPEAYLPGLGDCGRYWLDNKPTRKVTQILEATKAHCFAAHPFQQMGLLEKFIFRRGYWKHEDLNLEKKHGIRGIQFWNGIRDEGFKLGREFWINELGKGNYLLPIGGNDAHGDLNDTTAVATPLVSLKHSREHVFGKVRTVVRLPQDSVAGQSPLTLDSLNKAFDGDNCYITDGPALWWERNDEEREKTVTFRARSNSDYGGGFRYIRIFGRRSLGGKLARDEEVCMESQVAARQSTDITVHADNFAYLRAECETGDGHFAMTSAAKLD